MRLLSARSNSQSSHFFFLLRHQDALSSFSRPCRGTNPCCILFASNFTTFARSKDGGIQDVKFIPDNKESAALATAVHLGQVWIVYLLRTNADAAPTLTAHKASPSCSMTSDPRRATPSPSTATSPKTATLDISDLANVKRLDDPDSYQGIVGPHYIKVTPDQKYLVVTDYFVQTGVIGVINTPADYKALYIDILDNGALSFNRSIDFQNDFANRGGAKPHSVVVFDLTDPENSIYY